LISGRQEARLWERHVETDLAARGFLERGRQHTHELEGALLEPERLTQRARVAACELHPCSMAQHSGGPRLLEVGGHERAPALGWHGEYREEARADAHDTDLARHVGARERVWRLVRGVVRGRVESRCPR